MTEGYLIRQGKGLAKRVTDVERKGAKKKENGVRLVGS